MGWIVLGNGIPFRRGGGKQWQTYWATLISAVVDSDNPTDIILTFDVAGSGLTTSDFTVTGYTVDSLSYDATGKIITLTCTANVLATTITFNKGVGLTADVIVELARNTDTVLAGGYTDIVTVPNFSGVGTGGKRFFLISSHHNRIRSHGDIQKIQLHIGTLTHIVSIHFQVWRKDGATYDLIGTEDITSSLVPDTTITHTLTTPITAIEGDYCAVYVTGDGTTGSNTFAFNLINITNSVYYLSLEYDPTDFDIEAGTASVNVLPIKIYIQAPMIVGIGDSIISGHDINYSFIESTNTTDLDGHILAQLYILNNKYVFQNMGIGATSSTTNAARFTADVVNLKPKIALIGGFLSGLIQDENQATMIANLTNMLDACVTAGIAPVVCKINPWTDGTNEQMQTRDTIMTAAQALVATYPSAVWVDFDTAIGLFRVGGDAGNLWDIQVAYDGDGVHLNQAGYTKMAEVINTAILTKYTLA